MPAFSAAGTPASSAGTGSFNVPYPATVNPNDLALLLIEAPEFGLSTTPSGWTLYTSRVASNTALFVYYRVCAGTEDGTNVSCAANDPDHTYAVILTFSDINTASPFAGTTTNFNQSSSTTAVSIPSMTTTANNALVVGLCSRSEDNAGARFSGWANANLSSVAEVFDSGTTTGNGGGIGVATGIKASAGSTGSWTATLAGASTQASIALALAPQTHALTASPISADPPTLGSVALGVKHALVATAIATAAPVLVAPALTSPSWTPAALTAGAPVLDQPSIGQTHNLVASAISAGPAALDQPSMAVAHQLVAANIVAGLPQLGIAALGQVHALVASGIVGGQPVLGSPGFTPPQPNIGTVRIPHPNDAPRWLAEVNQAVERELLKREPAIVAGGVNQYFRGDKVWGPLTAVWVGFEPNGSITSTNVQSAISEVASEAQANLTAAISALETAIEEAAALLGALAFKNTVNNDDWSGADLEITNGGTGASSASAARSNLGIIASNIPSTATGDVAATNVQSAITELDNDKLPNAAVAPYSLALLGLGNATLWRSGLGLGPLATASTVAASSVTFSATGGIGSTDVQAALAELDTEKAPKASPSFTGPVVGNNVAQFGWCEVQSYYAAGSPALKVVGARQLGWGTPTGTETRTTFDTSTVTLPQIAERLCALIIDLRTHGLIGN